MDDFTKFMKRDISDKDVVDTFNKLKEKFGEDVVIKKFEKSKGWLSKKLSSSSNQMDQLANILEERSIWQRYGF